MEIGKFVKQREGDKAFIPSKFPPGQGKGYSNRLVLKHSTAERLLG